MIIFIKTQAESIMRGNNNVWESLAHHSQFTHTVRINPHRPWGPDLRLARVIDF